MSQHSSQITRATAGGVLVAMGIIFGDIGTSPLYVMKAIIGTAPISGRLVLGGLSAVFWTLTLQSTIKYVAVTLHADNKGEGGIFSLFALVRRKSPWLLFPAMLGGASLLADGVITPTISVSSAIEGLRIFNPDINTIPYVVVILTGIFFIQQFGTKKVGSAFGPIMLVWFTTLLVLGVAQIVQNPVVLKAFNPVYAVRMLAEEPGGFWLLGAVFLCTTGAEALYSDLGHVGRKNIQISWSYVKVALLANYFGQGAWLLQHDGELVAGRNPFYYIMPDWFQGFGIGLATVAAIIASQAVISGAFTLVAEAMRLDIWPKLKIRYPSNTRGQLYIPTVAGVLWLGCIAMILNFRESEHLEAAYGLTITLAMITTSLLLFAWLRQKGVSWVLLGLYVLVYGLVEFSFFTANVTKIMEGAWITLVISSVLITIMLIQQRARVIKNKLTDMEPLGPRLDLLQKLSADTSIPKFATHLVYLTASPTPTRVEGKVLYSILRKRPKRADLYWFLHVDVLDDPHTMEYKVHFLRDNIIWIQYRLGFRVEQKINLLFRMVVQELVNNGEVNITSRYPSLADENYTGDFRFVVLQRYLSVDNDLSLLDKLTMQAYFLLKRLSLSEERAFGLETSNVEVEQMPLLIEASEKLNLNRTYPEHPIQH